MVTRPRYGPAVLTAASSLFLLAAFVMVAILVAAGVTEGWDRGLPSFLSMVSAKVIRPAA